MTTFSRFLATTTVIGALAAAGLAFAHGGRMGGPGGPGPFGPGGVDFTAIDANADGALTRDELTARAVARIAVVDTDANGVVTRAEIIDAMPRPDGMRHIFSANPAEAMADRMLAMQGATAAGQIEVSALAEEQVNMLMTGLDEDRDDTLSQAEAEAPMERRAGRGHGGPEDRPRF